MIFKSSHSLATLLYLGVTVTSATPTPWLTLRDPPTPNNLTNRTGFGTGSNVTLESQNAIPVASVDELNGIFSERIAYRFIDGVFDNPNSTAKPNITARQVQARPRSVDWRLRWGVSWLHSVQNQGQCNSCWAFAAAALIETQTRIEHGLWAKRSEGDIRDGTLNSVPNNQMDYCMQGGDYMGALKWAQTNGITDLTCWPYFTFNVRTSATGYRPCAERSGRTVKIPSGATNLGTMIEVQKTWLDKVGPLIANLDIPDAFRYFKGAGVYSSPAEGQPGSQWVGQHSLLVVGYDDDRGAWLVRNSYGTGWGDGGYAWVRYGEMRMDNYWGKVGLRNTDPDPWSMRRHRNGNMVQSGRVAVGHKNMELAFCKANGYGNHWLRAGGENGDNSWRSLGSIWTPPPAGQWCQGQPALLTTTNNRNLALLYWSTGNFLIHKRYDQNTQRWTEAVQFGNARIGGHPALIQRNPSGALVSVVRLNDGSLVHYETSSSSTWDWRQKQVIAHSGIRMSGPSLIQTSGSVGNYYTVAVMDDSTLRLFWLNNDLGDSPSNQWRRGEGFSAFVGQTPPVMIQTVPTWAGTNEHTVGDFELFVVVAGRVVRYRRDNSDIRAGQAPLDVQDSESRWKLVDSFRSPDGTVKHVWSVMQGPHSHQLEVVVELHNGMMQTMFFEWTSSSWKLSIPAGTSIPIQ